MGIRGRVVGVWTPVIPKFPAAAGVEVAHVLGLWGPQNWYPQFGNPKP